MRDTGRGPVVGEPSGARNSAPCVTATGRYGRHPGQPTLRSLPDVIAISLPHPWHTIPTNFIVAEQSPQIAPPMRHAQDANVSAYYAINDNILTDRKAAAARPQVIVARTAEARMIGEQATVFDDGVDLLGRRWLRCDFPWRDMPRSRRGRLGPLARGDEPSGGFSGSAAKRSRPRRFTSSASARIDSCVMRDALALSKDASASSRLTRNSARTRSRSSQSESASFTTSSTQCSLPVLTACRTNSSCSGVRVICTRRHPD